MMWQVLLSALAFVFVLEGILPFLSPRLWRRSLQILQDQSDSAVDNGVLSMLVGIFNLPYSFICRRIKSGTIGRDRRCSVGDEGKARSLIC